MPDNTPKFLTIKQVAAWVLPGEMKIEGLKAAPPPLQRGSVWKPSQVEHIWESILRGFPIGNFLLAPRSTQIGSTQKSYMFGREQQNQHREEYAFDLLDGQQRSTAIAIGFLNAWSGERRGMNMKDALLDAPLALWIDIVSTALKGLSADGRQFLFRVTTRSHPWGYRRADPSRTLTAPDCRRAREEYKIVSSENSLAFKAGQIPLHHTWPWDSTAPVPLPLLIESLSTSNPREALLASLKRDLPYWENQYPLKTAFSDNWKEAVILRLRNVTDSDWIDALISAFYRLLGGGSNGQKYSIPAIVYDQPREIFRRDEQPDQLITLFERINRAGTVLDGEELQYSYLKSVWPECVKLVDSLSTKLMPPARLVQIVSRLVLTNLQRGQTPQREAPGIPDLGRFRRLIAGEDSDDPDRKFLRQLKLYIEGGRAKRLFDQAKKLLIMEKVDPNEFRLPPLLAAELASSKSQSHAFYLFLVWLDEQDAEDIELDEETHRRLIGTLTVLNWFADRPGDRIKTLWSKRDRLFAKESLIDLLRLREDRVQLVPLPPPHIFKAALNSTVACGNGFEDYTGMIWRKEFRWLESLTLQFAKSETVSEWCKDTKQVPAQDNASDAWRSFCEKVLWKKDLVLFAQRGWLLEWFPDFDPASPDRLDDTQRPFDYDHIHPQSYLANNTPNIVRTLHGSIGNIRAWPLGANRALSDAMPVNKLSDPSDAEIVYGMRKQDDLLRASFLGPDMDDWWDSVPSKEDTNSRYLAQEDTRFEKYHPSRRSLLKAITGRTIALYEHWYTQTSIGQLF